MVSPFFRNLTMSQINRQNTFNQALPIIAQLLADKNILDYMHYETLMFALSYLLDRLKSEMDASET